MEIDAKDPYEMEIIAYLEAIEEKKSVPILPAESLYVMQVVEAIKESLETGKTVQM